MAIKFLNILILVSLGAFASSSFAAVDPIQLENMRKYHSTVSAQHAEETEKDVKRDQLLSEHMKTLQENMQKFNAEKPSPNLSAQELAQWYADHLKAMNEMMEQMIADHQAILDMQCAEKSSYLDIFK